MADREARLKIGKACITTLTLALAIGTAAALQPGIAAPDFKGVDSNGKTQTLSQYRGKYVVLEWAN
jgi:hypothetical protein